MQVFLTFEPRGKVVCSEGRGTREGGGGNLRKCFDVGTINGAASALVVDVGGVCDVAQDEVTSVHCRGKVCTGRHDH